jgi:hypothetical protein
MLLLFGLASPDIQSSANISMMIPCFGENNKGGWFSPISVEQRFENMRCVTAENPV